MRIVLVLLVAALLAGCRHPQPVREEYRVTDREAVVCGDDVAVLEEMRRHIGYAEAAWARAENSLTECLRRQRDYEEKHARGEPATSDEVWRAELDKERREREDAERARVAAFTRDDYQVAYSALVCAYRSSRMETLKEIEKEKRYSAVGGVVNLSRRYQWQRLLRFLDENEERLLAGLKTASIPALRCNDAGVLHYSGCVSVGILERAQRMDVELKSGCAEGTSVRDLMVRASPRG